MGYFLALFSPFLDGILVMFDKIILSKYDINSTTLTVYSGAFALLTGVLVFLFTGLHADTKSAIFIILSGIFGVLYLWAYFKALTYSEASRVGSLFQLSRVLVFIMSIVILGERFLPSQYLGCVLIIISGFLLTIEKNTKGFFKINKSLFYMIISSLFAAGIYILFKIGVSETGFWEAIPYEGLGNGIGALLILSMKGNFKMLKESRRKLPGKVFVFLMISEAIYRISRFSLFMALVLLPVALVNVFQGFQPLFMIILGVILSLWFPKLLIEVINKETITLKIISAAGIFIGLYLIFKV